MIGSAGGARCQIVQQIIAIMSLFVQARAHLSVLAMQRDRYNSHQQRR